jgi:uncharacterized membrane protein
VKYPQVGFSAEADRWRFADRKFDPVIYRDDRQFFIVVFIGKLPHCK